MVKNAQNETLVPGIVSALRDRILNGTLHPGEPLHQASLAETLGVSLIPLREALRMMEADGLVEFEAHKGVRVAEVTSLEVLEWSLEVRALIGVLLPIMLPMLDEPAFAQLHRLAADKPSTLHTVHEFFSEILAPCGMPRLLHRVEQLLTRFGRYLPVGGGAVWAELRKRPPTLEDLVQACEARDTAPVLDAFEAYLMPWVREFRAVLESRP